MLSESILGMRTIEFVDFNTFAIQDELGLETNFYFINLAGHDDHFRTFLYIIIFFRVEYFRVPFYCKNHLSLVLIL